LPGRVKHGFDQEANVAAVDAGDRVAEPNGNITSEAGGKAEHVFLPAGAGNSPAFSAVIAAPQSMLASSVPGLVMLSPVRMN
jgi:hypothetical protein